MSSTCTRPTWCPNCGRGLRISLTSSEVVSYGKGIYRIRCEACHFYAFLSPEMPDSVNLIEDKE